jgi:hypothetical protein
MARWRRLGDGFGMVVPRSESVDGVTRRLRVVHLSRGRYELHVFQGATLMREGAPQPFLSEKAAWAAAGRYLRAGGASASLPRDTRS